MSDSETKVETKDEKGGSKLMPETDIPPFKDNFMGAHGTRCNKDPVRGLNSLKKTKY